MDGGVNNQRENEKWQRQSAVRDPCVISLDIGAFLFFFLPAPETQVFLVFDPGDHWPTRARQQLPNSAASSQGGREDAGVGGLFGRVTFRGRRQLRSEFWRP